jgi:hypothetical protein
MKAWEVSFRSKLREGCFLGIHFDELAALAASPNRPIDDVSKGRGCPSNDHKIAGSTSEIIFNSLQFVPRQLLAEPHPAA